MTESKSQGNAPWEGVRQGPGSNPAENYERFFVPVIGDPVAKDLIEIAALLPGERVLDVACGTGVATRLAAKRVGESGAVAGVDVNNAMLAVARSVSPPERSIEWHEASAEAMPLPDGSFDVVLCALGLQFVRDKAAALREMRRVLVPGGRVLVSLPGPMPPLFAVAHDPVRRHLGPEAAGFLHMVFSLHDPAEIRELFEDAGFREPTFEQDEKVLTLPAPAEFLWQYLSSTPVAAMVAQASEETRDALAREVVDEWQAFVSDEGMTYRQKMVVANARK